MNTTTSPENQEATHLEKLRSQLSTDIETMHQKEASLKEYEQRLRLLVDHAHHSPPPSLATQYLVTSADPHSTAQLNSQWEKYERAHALLEAARRSLCDDRLAFKERDEKLHLRDVDVSRREAWVKVREQELDTQAQAKEKAEIKARPSFTTAPFLAPRHLFTQHS
ncbi:MAG: hypothetical protein EXS42_01600 [Lacunisphaera sp.]|nr:hypothetical protein [Lacunisphaera sp.]